MRSTGFTLIEMLITLVIASILLGVAYPAFNNMVNNNRLASTANSFIGALAIARNEAINRGQSVSVQAKTPQADNEWGGGWTVELPDPNNPGSTIVIRDFASLDQQSITLDSSNDVSTITFNARGFLTPTQQDTVDIQIPNSTTSRLVTVTASGVTRIEKK